MHTNKQSQFKYKKSLNLINKHGDKITFFTKNIFFLIFSFFITTAVNTQVYLNWAINPSDLSAWEQNASSIVTDNSGNIYVTGYYAGTVDFDPGSGIFNLTSVGENDIFIAKYNDTGQLIFAKSIGGSSNEITNNIVLDKVGNIYICGYFNGTVDFDPSTNNAYLSCSGGSDVFFAKYDNYGNYIYAKSFPGANIDNGTSLTIDNLGNVFITGYFWGGVDFDSGSGTEYLYSSGRTDVFIAKYNSTGNYVTAKKAGGSSDDSGVSIAHDNKGNIYITGYFQNTVDFDPGSGTVNLTSAGAQDIFVAKYDTSLNLKYAVRLGGPGTDICTSIAVDSVGNLTLCGFFNGTVDFDPGTGINNLISEGAEDIFYARLDTAGELIFANSIGGSLSDVANSVSINSKGDGYITGYFNGTADFNPGAGTANFTSAGNTDIFVYMFDTNGNYVYAKSMGGTSEDKGNGIAISNNGRLYATGFFNGTADFDPGNGVTELTANSSDIFITALISPDICITGNTITINSGDLTPSLLDNTDFGMVCPNEPSTQIFNIQNTGSAIMNIISVDISGSGSSYFSAINVPTNIQPGNNEDLSIVFTPPLIGQQTAIITINSDVPGRETFNFAIQAEAADTTKPIILCTPNIIANNDSSLCGAYVNYSFPIVTDNCFDVTTDTQTFNYTGSEQTWTVPEGVYEITIEAYGAQGGNGSYHGAIGYGGTGGYSQGKLAVTPGQLLYIYVGQQGAINTGANRITAFNGGGAGYGGSNGERGSGGGASDVRVNGNTFADRVIVAGGGGGAVSYDGGTGGGLTGGSCTGNPNCGGGGTQTAGGTSGWYPGTFGLGGSNVASSNTFCGGGGGYYGGGAGNSGGGGSGYIGGVYNGITTNGVNTGNGKVVISWTKNYTDLTAGLPSGSFFPKGKTTNTFLSTDPYGNQATCSFDIIINDNEPPTLTCPENGIFSTDSGLCTYTIINPEKTVHKTYYIEQANLVNFFECEPLPISSFVNNYEDVGFNWTDTESGTATSIQLTLSVGTECNSGVFHNTTFNSFNETPFQTPYWCNCQGSSTPNNIVSMSLDPQNYIIGGINQFRILNSMYNLWGLIQDASLNNYFAVIDVTYQQAVELNPIIADNCGISSVTYTLSGATTGSGSGNIDGATLNAGKTYVLWEIKDESNNLTSCTSYIIVKDNEAPIITCNSTQTRNNDSGLCSYTSSANEFAPVIVTDNCSAITLINNYNSTSSLDGESFPKGSTYVTWTASDTSGNSNNCSTEIIINDNENPIINCYADQNRNSDIGTCFYQVNGSEFDPEMWSDNCNGAVISYNLTGATIGSGSTLAGQIFNQGLTYVVWTISDLTGKSTACSFQVNINDISVPVPDIAVLPDIIGECNATISVTPTASDLCQGAIAGTTNDILTYNSQGIHTVNWTYDDGKGNTFTQTQKVIITDVSKPDIPQLTDLKAECSITATPPQTTDNCAGVVTATTADPLSYNTQGNYIINWQFDDGNGNILALTQNVIIDDTTKADILVLPDLTEECSITATPPQTTDNCSGVVTATTTDPLMYNTQGNYIINWQFDDGNGNILALTQNVIIDDTTKADILVLPDLTDECSLTVTPPQTTDNCSGVVTATTTDPLMYNTQGNYIINWQFDDGNGNVLALIQNVIIDDTIAPVPTLTSLPDINEVCEINELIAPTANDNCTSTVTVYNDAIFPINMQGNTTITWTFDDNNGNLSYLAQNIIISAIDVSTTLLQDTIKANYTGGYYQWVDCNNLYSHIFGETEQTFVPVSNGSYAVIIYVGNCADTSDCNDITTDINLIEPKIEDYFNIYPNPNNGSFVISTNILGKYEIVNEYGSSVMQLNINENTNNIMEVNNLTSGLYVIYGFNNNKIIKHKIIVIK